MPTFQGDGRRNAVEDQWVLLLRPWTTFHCCRSKFSQIKKLLVMFHEFAHFLMHSPDTNTTASFHGFGQKTRKEREADTFALCALIPKIWIEEREISELIDDGFPAELLAERVRIYRAARAVTGARRDRLAIFRFFMTGVATPFVSLQHFSIIFRPHSSNASHPQFSRR